MSEDDGTDPARAPRHRMILQIGANLFASWQRRDPGARNEVWTKVWEGTYPFAVGACRRFAPDDLAARELGQDAIVQAFCEMDAKVDRLTWLGDEQFTGMMVRLINRRALDGFRTRARHASHIDDLFFGDADDRGELGITTPGALVEEIRARTQETIAAIVHRLGQVRERCRTRQVLVDVVDAMIDYVRDCCARAVSGVKTDGLSLDELVPLMDHDSFEASKIDLNRFVRQRLKIDAPTLHDRRREIRTQLGLPPRCGERGVSTAI